MAKKEEQKGRYGIGKVATQTEDVIVDNTEKDDSGSSKTYTIQEFLVKIGNDIEELKKSLIQ